MHGVNPHGRHIQPLAQWIPYGPRRCYRWSAPPRQLGTSLPARRKLGAWFDVESFIDGYGQGYANAMARQTWQGRLPGEE